MRYLFAAGAVAVSLSLASCGGDSVDDLNGALDLYIPSGDSNGSDNMVGIDLGGRDVSVPSDLNVGEDQAGSVDTGLPYDAATDDTAAHADANGPEDVEMASDHGGVADVDAMADDDAGPDASDPGCNGQCTFGSDAVWCMDGLNICSCTEAGQWTAADCASACASARMVGTQCTTASGAAVCDCVYDCTQPALVEAQCTDQIYTPCTCAALDPCSWQGDGYCDEMCEMYYPEESFDEPLDCACSGSCDASSFVGFCDNGGGTCSCQGGSKISVDCLTFCAEMGATKAEPGWCFVSNSNGSSQPVALCNCENYECTNSPAVGLQCENLLYTPCTCAASNPCGWIGDGYCDGPTCDKYFPDQDNLDDSASDC